MDYVEVREGLRKAKREALANSCNIKIDRRELEVVLKALEIVDKELPDIREKVKEYVSELDAEIDRCVDEAESILAAIGDYDEKSMPTNYIRLEERAKALEEVKNDLQDRLEELV